jgi:membrane protein implicated in regulation of membrane protease activity
MFLAWFGAVGYLLQRHSPWSALADLVAAVLVGVAGMFILAYFIRWMQAREHPLDPADYRMAGVLGKVSSPIRPDGVGEVIYLRDGSRTPLPARSENGQAIGRGVEVIVTRYEKGIAYVRTWDEMTQVSFQQEKQNEQ